MQNVSQLVLTSSRKKYVQRDEGLAGLETEKSVLSLPHQSPDAVLPAIPVKFSRPSTSLTPCDHSIINQMTLIEKRMFENRWPDCLAVETIIGVLFDRLKIVRDINKKHI